MADQVVQIRAELDNAVLVRPGDKLVVGLSGRLDMAIADTIKRRLGERLPGVDVVLIDTCTGLAVYRPDERPTRKIGYAVTDDEIEAMRKTGVIDADGKTTMDRIMERLPGRVTE